jgi:magnesium chelatase family protein
LIARRWSGTGNRHKATQLCRCGYGGLGKGHCGKAPRCQRDYGNRVSGPLLDRIDLQIEVPAVTAADLALAPPAEDTAEAAERVAQARAVQDARAGTAATSALYLNARLEGERLAAVAGLDDPGKALLTRAAEAGHLTARGWTRTLRLARTIADLDGSDPVRRAHVAEALIYRRTGASAEGVVST